jgi:meso-butanediol dehydrogenase / (S,S)-butanediol dehydrogenase / diacetyl reductase
MSLNGKVAIVTGSNKGIGAKIASTFAAAGAKVVVTGRNVAAGEKTAQAIRDGGGEAVFIAADISSEANVKQLVASTVKQFGGVDIVVNNAAAVEYIGQGGDHPLTEQTTEQFDYIMKVGIYAPYWCCKYAIPEMKNRGGGSIVNISSVASTHGLPGTPAYTCSKAALNGLTRQVAVDYAKDNIRSNCIVVGFILSGDVADLFRGNPAFTETLNQALLSRRMGETEDIANAALFLASDQNVYVNGVCLPVDGGLSAKSTLPDFSAMLGQLAAGS